VTEERYASLSRDTSETHITAELKIDGKGLGKINTGIGFFDHMLVLWSAHGRFDLQLNCTGDLHIDGHHSVEDIGIVMGKAFSQALKGKKGIKRYGTVFLPMDESMIMVSLDISGRPYLHFEVPQLAPLVGSFDTQLLEEFFKAFTVHSGITLHIRVLYGRNTHHIIEGIFKAFGRALREAVSIDAENPGIPSTKGLID